MPRHVIASALSDPTIFDSDFGPLFKFDLVLAALVLVLFVSLHIFRSGRLDNLHAQQ